MAFAAVTLAGVRLRAKQGPNQIAQMLARRINAFTPCKNFVTHRRYSGFFWEEYYVQQSTDNDWCGGYYCHFMLVVARA
jgi:hypothetical protein